MKNRIVIWGTGDRTKKLMEWHCFDNCEIVGMIDSNSDVNQYMEYKVYHPEQIMEIISKVDYIVISNQYYEEILHCCFKLNIPIDKIILTDNVLNPVYRECYTRLESVLPDVYERVKDIELQTVKINLKDYYDDSLFYKKSQNIEYKIDYFRYRTFEFVSEEIISNNIDGSIAELGVFRGIFSALLNEKFNNRKLFLFDTFDGFNDVEAEKEKKLGRCDDIFIMAHRDTSVERMLSSLPYPEQAVVCQGFFPDSLTEEAKAQNYAFVSIDVDFEESTYQGLKFFYPRLCEGGYIFIHDYNSYLLDGIRKAVKRYEEDNGIFLKKVPLADWAGTLVIVK